MFVSSSHSLLLHNQISNSIPEMSSSEFIEMVKGSKNTTEFVGKQKEYEVCFSNSNESVSYIKPTEDLFSEDRIEKKTNIPVIKVNIKKDNAVLTSVTICPSIYVGSSITFCFKEITIKYNSECMSFIKDLKKKPYDNKEVFLNELVRTSLL